MYKVKELKTKKRQYIVIFDGEKSSKEYLISEELLLEYWLVRGKELDETTYQSFLNALQKDTIYQKVLHYALYKQRCTFEIVTYLEHKSVEQEVINYCLHRLYKANILNDERYVETYVADAIDLKRFGPKKIRFELTKKHIKKDLIDAALSSINKTKERENAMLLLEKKLHSKKPQSISKTINQLKQFLLNKGYDFELVNQIIDANRSMIEQESHEDKALEEDIKTAFHKYRNITEKRQEKILAFLLRKGYQYHKIKARLGVYENE